jgi:hypothetical protein
METLVRAGGLTALGTGLAALIGGGGFAVYAMLSATIANVVGLVGLTLPFSAYLMATSCWLSSPIPWWFWLSSPASAHGW